MPGWATYWFCALLRSKLFVCYSYIMDTVLSPHDQRRVGPYSRAVQRGAVSDVVDGRSREGKYLRRIEAELLAQMGASPTFSAKLLIRQISVMMLRLEEFDNNLDAGRMTEFIGLQNAVRLALRDLGLSGPMLAEALALP